MDDASRFQEIVSDYVSEAKRGRFEKAYDGLIDMTPGIIPFIENAYVAEKNADIRVMLLEVLFEFRSKSSIGLLETALSDPCSEVWKKSLDVLVTISGHESLAALERSLASLGGRDRQRKEWIEEAIEQVRDSL